MMHERNGPSGRVTITLREPVTGVMLERRVVDNLVTLAGRELLSDLLTGTVTGFEAMELAVGAGTTGTQLDDVELDNELVAVQVTHGATVPLADTGGDTRMVTPISGTFEAEVGGPDLAITEAGIKITKVGGEQVLYNRVVFPVIHKAANLQMTLTWEVIF